jgi:hypothetical protein
MQQFYGLKNESSFLISGVLVISGIIELLY